MENLLFKYKNEHMPSKGCLLISEPHLPDYNFERSVIYLCEHNQEGSFGLVLNKGSEYNIGDLIPDIELETPVRIGGPVESNTLHYLYRNAPKIEGGIQVGKNIFWGGAFEALLNWAGFNKNQQEILFFIGYSGWGKGQLQEEVDRNSWIVFPEASEQLVFEIRKKNLWKEVLKEMEEDFLFLQIILQTHA
jgi:putative transcriptional regulator